MNAVSGWVHCACSMCSARLVIWPGGNILKPGAHTWKPYYRFCAAGRGRLRFNPRFHEERGHLKPPDQKFQHTVFLAVIWFMLLGQPIAVPSGERSSSLSKYTYKMLKTLHGLYSCKYSLDSLLCKSSHGLCTRARRTCCRVF